MKPIYYIIFSFFFTGIIAGQQSSNSIDKEAVLAVLAHQEDAWNQGNIESFMKGYWDNDKLVFVGSNGPTYGYRNTLERYLKSYPTKAAMGQLKFNVLFVEQCDTQTIQVIGKFTLDREKDQPTGFFTLLFRKMGDDWKIVSDHSSASN